MKIFKVTIKIQGLMGTTERVYEIKAKTWDSAQKKAFAIIGNQTGEIISILQSGICK
jgi:hypothetical protein